MPPRKQRDLIDLNHCSIVVLTGGGGGGGRIRLEPLPASLEADPPTVACYLHGGRMNDVV